MQIADRFTELVSQNQYWEKNDKVLIAVSGGVDSMVLLHLVTHLPEKYKPNVSVAHIDHQLRSASTIELSAVEKLVKSLNLPFYHYTWDKKNHPKSGIEKAAREVRYRFFYQVMLEQGITKLLTGHHKGDQAETVLMRIVRGSALNHLSGILEKRVIEEKEIIRPLLSFSKKELYEYSEHHKLNFYEDESNQSASYTRNRYRNNIIPLLKKENDEVETHITDFANDLQDILTIVNPVIEQRAQRCLVFEKDAVIINQEAFIHESESMQRLILKNMLDRLYNQTTQQYKKVHLKILHDWLYSEKANSTIELPGEFVGIKEYNEFKIRKERFSESEFLSEPIKMEIEKWLSLPDGKKIGLFLSNQLPDLKKQEYQTCFFDIESIRMPLTVRHKMAGDRISIKGMEGSKKVQRILIDQKVPPSKRNETIIVEDVQGHILWVVGMKESTLSIPSIPDKIQYVLILKE